MRTRSRREPGVQHRPDVAEQHLHGDEPEPEDDQHEPRRQVPVRRGLADQRGQEDQHEQPGREQAEQDVEGLRAQHPLEPLGKRSAGSPALELRPLPEHAEREEREDDDDRRSPEEEPAWDGEIANAAQAVGEEAQGRTSSSAIWTPLSSSSISNRPGASAVKRIVAGAPGATSAIRS
jgi:hypothetical protein